MIQSLLLPFTECPTYIKIAIPSRNTSASLPILPSNKNCRVRLVLSDIKVFNNLAQLQLYYIRAEQSILKPYTIKGP